MDANGLTDRYTVRKIVIKFNNNVSEANFINVLKINS